MNEPSVVRLLYRGLPPAGNGGEPSALPFSPEEAAASPLALPESSAPWKEGGCGAISWLEKAEPGLPGPLYITGAATSTLDAARVLLEAGAFPEWASLLSLCQSAGRGQMRRNWSSPAGNLYSALRLPSDGPFAGFAAAPACGALTAEALCGEGCPVMLKWPNDILQAAPSFRPGVMPGREDCRKVGGMLIEERHGALIAGIGLNAVSCPPLSSLRDNYAFAAGILAGADGLPLVSQGDENGKENKDIVTIFTLWRRLAGRMFSCYATKNAPTPWWPALAQKHLAFKGCLVTLDDACPETEAMVRIPCVGRVDGVTESGALRLSTAYGTETFLGGSLLPGSEGLPSSSE